MSNVASMLAAANAKRAAAAPAAPAPKAKEQPAITWDSVDPSALPDDIRELFYAIGKARSLFEARMTALLEPPAHLKLVFAYKRGLAIGLAPARTQQDGLAALMSRLTAAE